MPWAESVLACHIVLGECVCRPCLTERVHPLVRRINTSFANGSTDEVSTLRSWSIRLSSISRRRCCDESPQRPQSLCREIISFSRIGWWNGQPGFAWTAESVTVDGPGPQAQDARAAGLRKEEKAASFEGKGSQAKRSNRGALCWRAFGALRCHRGLFSRTHSTSLPARHCRRELRLPVKLIGNLCTLNARPTRLLRTRLRIEQQPRLRRKLPLLHARWLRRLLRHLLLRWLRQMRQQFPQPLRRLRLTPQLSRFLHHSHLLRPRRGERQRKPDT